MTQVRRYDVGKLGGATRTPQGGLRIPAALTRSGVLDYLRADGSVQREYRPPEEVFAEASLASLRDAPVTDLHPADMVGPETFAAVARGNVSGIPSREGDLVSGEVVIQGADLVAKVDRGEAKEISPGYVCSLDFTPGVTPDGEHYDAIQRGITYNHVALGPEGWGRSGARVSLRTDSTDAGQSREAWRLDAGGHALPPGIDTKDNMATQKKKDEAGAAPAEADQGASENTMCPTCGAPVDAEGKYHAPAPATPVDDACATDPKMDALKARIDGLEAELRAEKAKKKDAADRARFDSAVADRVDLLRLAEKAGVEKLDGSDRDLRVAVVAKALPEMRLDGKSDAYVEAAFDMAREKLGSSSLSAIAAGAVPTNRTDNRTPIDPIAAAKAQLRKDGVI